MSHLSKFLRDLRRRYRLRRVREVKREAPVGFGEAEFIGACSVGAYSYFNGRSLITNAVIGRYCSVANGAVIGTLPHSTDRLGTHPLVGGGARGEPITIIGHDVWVGTNGMIIGGVRVGHGCVIAAGAVVTHDVAPYSVVAGVPARHLRYRFDDETIARLLRSLWWDFDLGSASLGEASVTEALNIIEQGGLPRLPPYLV